MIAKYLEKFPDTLSDQKDSGKGKGKAKKTKKWSPPSLGGERILPSSK